MRIDRKYLCTFLALVAAALVIGPATSAEGAYVHTFSSSFSLSPAGEPGSVAVDDETGSVYVLNIAEGPGAGTIQKFNSSGIPTNFSSLGTNVLKTGCASEYEENQCVQIAVDNSGGVNQGTIYVSTEVSVFEPENTGVRVFLPSGAAAGRIHNRSEANNAEEIETYAPFCGVAIDLDGNVYIAHPGSGFTTGLIDKYHPEDWTAHPTQVPPITATASYFDFNNGCKSAVDSTGATNLILGFGPGGTGQLRRVAATSFGPPSVGLRERTSTQADPLSSYAAFDTANDDLYSDRRTNIGRIDRTGSLLETFGGGELTSSIGVAANSSSKTVYASNLGTGDISIYTTLTTPDLNDVIAEPSDSSSVDLSAEVNPLGAGDVTDCHFEYKLSTDAAYTSVPCQPATPYTGPTSVTAAVTGLAEGVPYRYRLVASNANGTTVSSIDTFRIEAPSVEGTFVSDLTATSAVLHAEINPHGASTTYRFEYGKTAAYGSTAPVPDGELAGSSSPQNVSVQVSGLDEQFTYHFRVVAINTVGTANSDDQSFNFFPPSCPNSTVRQQSGSAYLPDCRSYELVSPQNAGSVLFFSDFGIPAPYASNPARFTFSGSAGAVTGTEPPNSFGADIYVATRKTTGWVTTFPGVPGSQARRSEGMAGNLGLSAFMSFKRGSDPSTGPPFVNRADGTFISRWPANLAAIPDGEESFGAYQPSPDFSHLAFSSNNVAFVPNGLVTPPGSAYDYDASAGTTSMISKTPAGEDIPQEPGNAKSPNEVIRFPSAGPDQRFNGGGVGPAVIHPGVSKNGSHILMSTASGPGEDSAVHLYMRVGGGNGVTYDVSRGAYVNYAGMTDDGSEVFFTATGTLTPDDHDTSVDLYRWSEEGDVLTRLSVGSGGSGGDVDTCNASWTSKCNATPVPVARIADSSVAHESGDIYFYSPEQLDGTNGIAGQQNLYLYRDGAVSFVAIASVTRMQVAPDGSHMAMIANEQLTSYDNVGLDEMYTYEPATGRLRCSSCIPGGVQPTDSVEGSLNGLFMSNDGRTFFYTADALVPQDTNALHDVYEFTEARPQLISSGTGSQDSQIISFENVRAAGLSGVSADGVDVYFSTYDVLVDEDENGQFLKFYDARTNGGFPVDPPLQPCVAADECHGRGSSPPSPPALISEGDLGAGGNLRTHPKRNRGPKKKHRAGKRRRNHRHEGRRTHG